ncbi:M28 family peptidase [Thermofilum pendens]|uniref:Aminopeptidase Iap family-like protein n=1 Tax=Thermofilum pendens (strain DSM 2475 / Hrk 5) TaxID=368408 RepID=A1RYQ2_THEPD|nr:M28 family peptidase [Thermofilum pendens]ABL78332.1 aminopeptidase Iap family-like protein [Thermofilum pendens Hrk 5]
MKIREIAYELTSALPRGDVVAGSREEHESLEAVAGYLDGLSAQVHYFPCSTWVEKGVELSGGGLRVKAVAMPGSPSGELYLEPVYLGERVLPEEWEGVDLEGKIAVVKMYGKVDEAAWQYVQAVARGAEAVVFVDPFPDRRRRIVVTATPDYRFGPGTPPPVPAVAVSLEDGLRLARVSGRGEKLYLRVETAFDHSARTGVVVAGNAGGPLFTAHVDKWLSGFTDNVLGVALVVALSRAFGESAGYAVFGAEEYGAPGHSPWYWIWGSRSYADFLERRGELDSLGVVVNLDVLGGAGITVSASGPDFQGGLGKALGEGYRYTSDQVIFDSFSFTMKGVAAATLHTFQDVLPVYHTDLDEPQRVDWEKVLEAYTLAERAGEAFLREEWGLLEYSLLKRVALEKLEKVYFLEEARRVAGLLEGVNIRDEHDARHLRRLFTRPLHRGRYGEVFSEVEAVYPYILDAVEDLLVLKRAVEEGSRSVPARIFFTRIVPGWEEVLVDLEPPGKRHGGVLKEYYESFLRAVRRSLESMEEALLELKR